MTRQATFRHLGLILAALAAVLLVVAAYSNSLDNSFHFDDAHVVENNLYIRSLSNIPRFFADANTFSSLPPHASYRPVVSTTLAIDYAIAGGLNPRQFHRTQIALLLLLGVLLVLFYHRVLREADAAVSVYVPIVAAALFCVHTANTETMNLISARSELLSVLGVVGSFVVYLEYPQWRRTGLHLLPMVLGSLAKVHAVMYAPLLFAYVFMFWNDQAPARRRWQEAFRATWPSFAVAAVVYLLIRLMDGPQWTMGGGSRIAYAWTQPFVWLHYARLFVLPAGLTADSDWQTLPVWYDTRAMAGLAFIVALITVVLRTWRARETRPIAFGIVWFAVALAPTSSLVPLAEVVNEHRVFFPFVGLTIAVACAGVLLVRRAGAVAVWVPRAAVALTALVLLAHAVGTWDRNRIWRTEQSLWLDVTQKSPRNGRGMMNYGLTRMAGGDLQGARDEFERAAILTPNYSTLEVNLGIVYGALGERTTAETHFRRALALDPDADAHYYYARWLTTAARGPEAITHLRQAVALSPARLDARALLMRLDAASGDDRELLTVAMNTLAIDPRHAQAAAYAHNDSPVAERGATLEGSLAAGLAALSSSRFDEAAEYFRQMIRLNPQSADGWNNLGWAQLQLGFREQAKASLQRALTIDPAHERARNNLTLAAAKG
ncbi:MAG: tetratricopeptide repeat protein [Acidobacteriota bacterium]